LNQCKSIEKRLGRQERERWHEREIDIDIILYGNKIILTEILSIPHERMSERRFVLQPATDIAGEMIHPKFDKTISQLLEICKDKCKVEFLSKL